MKSASNESGAPASLSSANLEGQMLIAMPALRDGPFARAVVYLCAHREDGAMGIIVNQKAEAINFPELLVQLDVVKPDESIVLPPRAGEVRVLRGRPGREGARLRAAFARLFRRQFDGRHCRRHLPDRHARHIARHRQRAKARRRRC